MTANNVLSPMGPPGGWHPMTEDDRLKELVPVQDFSILNTIMPRMWSPTPKMDPILCLEVIAGPYKSIVFTIDQFEVLPIRLENGMNPVKFDTTIRVAPEGFTKDEAWDNFAGEVILAWLSFVTTHDLKRMMRPFRLSKHGAN